MISVRRAVPADAPGIAAVHVAGWRSAYPGILPDDVLTQLSVSRQSSYYDYAIRIGGGMHVAVSTDEAVTPASARIVGFSSARRTRSTLGEGEVETLYVLDDFRDQGIGKALLRAAANHLANLGCASAFAWVLRDNPSHFFYSHLGGKRTATGTTRVGGEEIPQTAFAWDPIKLLLDVDAHRSFE